MLPPGSHPAGAGRLTLRAVGGLTTEQIARGFLVPTSTIAQRISRAKSLIRGAGARFELPTPGDLLERASACGGDHGRLLPGA